MKKRALIITHSGFQDHELVYPYYRLLGDNFKVDIVAEKRDGNGRIYGILGTNMPCTILLDEFCTNLSHYLSEYDMLVIPGGVKSLEKLRLIPNVISFISNWNSLGKVISSTCHGAQLLISAKIVKGKKISGYYSIQDDIINAGATYSKDPVVVDDNIISSPHYDHMGIWMETTLKVYYEKNA